MEIIVNFRMPRVSSVKIFVYYKVRDFGFRENTHALLILDNLSPRICLRAECDNN